MKKFQHRYFYNLKKKHRQHRELFKVNKMEIYFVDTSVIQSLILWSEIEYRVKIMKIPFVQTSVIKA